MPGSAGQAPKASSERIRSELLKLGISVAKRTIQRYMRGALTPTPPHGQSWKTFLANHTVWACDFLQVYDIWFRPLFAFFVIDKGIRQRIPSPSASKKFTSGDTIRSIPILAGLHHDYQVAA